MPLLTPCVSVRVKSALPRLVKFPALYGTLGFNTGVHHSLPLAHILDKINPVHALQSYSFGSHFNIIFPSTPMLQVFLFHISQPETCRHFHSPACEPHALPMSSVSVRLDQWEIRRVTTLTGLRGGCCLSPILVSLYNRATSWCLYVLRALKWAQSHRRHSCKRFTNKPTEHTARHTSTPPRQKGEINTSKD